MSVRFLTLLLEAIPVLYRVWKEVERDKRDADIKDDVYRAWSDKFGELCITDCHQGELSKTTPESPKGE